MSLIFFFVSTIRSIILFNYVVKLCKALKLLFRFIIIVIMLARQIASTQES